MRTRLTPGTALVVASALALAGCFLTQQRDPYPLENSAALEPGVMSKQDAVRALGMPDRILSEDEIDTCRGSRAAEELSYCPDDFRAWLQESPRKPGTFWLYRVEAANRQVYVDFALTSYARSDLQQVIIAFDGAGRIEQVFFLAREGAWTRE